MTQKVKNPPANAGDTGDVGSLPGSGRSPGEGNGDPLQCSWLENSWRATVHEVKESQTQLSDEHFHFRGLNTFGCFWGCENHQSLWCHLLLPSVPLTCLQTLSLMSGRNFCWHSLEQLWKPSPCWESWARPTYGPEHKPCQLLIPQEKVDLCDPWQEESLGWPDTGSGIGMYTLHTHLQVFPE